MRLDPDDVDTLHTQLAWLTKREGFVQRRLAQTGIVDELLRGSQSDNFERLRHRFVSAIYSLPEDQAELLLDVFALSAETSSSQQLKERRVLHGRKIDRKVDTVRTREHAALKQLHSRLVDGRYAQSPLVLDVPEMHGGIIYEATDTLVLVENRRWTTTIEHYRFANMAGELDYVTIGRSYPAVVTPRPGGDFKVNSRAVEGAGWNDHFWHLDDSRTKTSPMADLSVHDLFFRLQPLDSKNEASSMTLASRAFHERSLLATIEVRFVGDVPATIWKFEGASPFARPTAADEYSQVFLDERQACKLVMRDVHGGRFNGFSWQW